MYLPGFVFKCGKTAPCQIVSLPGRERILVPVPEVLQVKTEVH